MSEYMLSSLAAAINAARNIRDHGPWLTGELRQMLDVVLAFVFVAEDVACSSMIGNAAAEALLRAPRNANLAPSVIDARGKRRFNAFNANGILLADDQLPFQRAARGEVLANDELFELRFEDGAHVFLQGAAIPLRDEKGAINGVIAAFTPVSPLNNPEFQAGMQIGARRDPLQAGEEPFRDLAKFAPAILWVADGDGAAIAHNDNWLSFTGQTQEQALGAGWMAALHPDDIEPLGKRWLESVATGADFDAEHHLRRASDGAWRWHLAKATLRRDDLGRPLRWYGTCVDIEDRKQAETAKRESDKLFRTVFDNAAAGIAISEAALDGIFLHANNRLCEMLGYGPGELAGRSFTELTHPDDRRINAEKLEALLAREMTTCTIEKRYLKRDGSSLWAKVNLALIRDEDNKPGFFIGSMADIGDLKRAEQALRGSEERFRVLVETTAQVVFETDRSGELIGDLPTWRVFNGLTPDDWSHESWANMVHPEDRDRAIADWRTVVKAGTTFHNEYRLRRADAVWRWGSVTAAPVRGADGQIVKWVGMISDITERKRADEALRRSEKRLRFALKGAHAGAWQWNIPTGELDWSPEMLALYERDPLLGAPRFDVWRTWLHPDDIESTDRAIDDAVKGRLPEHSAHFRVVLPSGGVRWMETLASLEFAADGTPLRMFGINLDITERKQAEEALRQSEQHLRFALKGAHAGTWQWQIPTGEMFWSPETFALFERDPQLGAPRYEVWRTRVHPDDLRSIDRAIRDALKVGMSEQVAQYRAVLASGDIRWIETLGSLEFAADGTPLRMYGINLDITERKRAEEDLRQSEERLRFALKGARAGVWQWIIATGEMIWSPEMFALFERDPELGELRYDGWRSCLHPDDLEPTERTIGDALESRQSDHTKQYRVILPSGGIRWIESLASTEFAADGTPLRLHGINRDITERKQAEQQLAESEARFRVAQESSLDGFVIYEPITDESGGIVDLKVIYINPIAAKYCLYAPEEMEGRGIGDLVPGSKAPGGFIDQTRRIIESGNSSEFFIEYAADGITGYFRNLVVPFGRHAAVTVRDDTELMRDAKALGRAKAEAERANFAKSKFLASASHDLRQPVQSLILLMAVIKRLVVDRPQASEAVGMAEGSIKSLNQMLNGFLDISRLDAGVIQPVMASVDAGEIVGRLASEYGPRAAASGLTLRCRLRDFHARTDSALLERILRNLLENALRYTTKGGVLIGLRQRGDRVRFDVIDTGIGIPADKQVEIFEEFRQLDNPARDANLGLGLGLAIVSRLARLLGAEVQVSSRPGRGARFSLLLPLERAAPVAVEAKPAVDNPGGRILVIEDVATLRQAYEMMLRFSGYEVISAGTGEEALALAAQEGWRFDAVLADHRLGAGLTGTETAKEIRRRADRAIPTMIVTGDTARERLAEVSASGFTMLHKPVDADELCEALAFLLSGAPGLRPVKWYNEET